MSVIGDAYIRVRPETGGFAAETEQQVGAAVQQVGARLQNAGKSISQAGTKLTLGLTLPLVALGKQAVDTVVDFEKGMNTMAAVAKVPGPELEKLRQTAIKLGQDTVFSANEVVTAQLELAKAGVSTADILGGALKNALDLATAGDIDLATASSVAATAVNVFGLAGKETQQAVDALAGAANASQAGVADLAEALSNGATTAVQAGLSIQEVTAAFAAFAKAGILGGEAGASLQTFLLRLPGVGAPATEAIKKLGLEFFKANGDFKSLADISEELQTKLKGLEEVQRAQILTTIFGSRGIRAANILARQGAEGIEKLTKATSDQGNAARVAEGRMKGLPGVVERLKGAIDTFLLTVGTKLAPIIEDAAKVISGLLEKFQNLPDAVQSNIVKFALLAATLGPLLKIVGGLTRGVGGLLTLGAGLKTVAVGSQAAAAGSVAARGGLLALARAHPILTAALATAAVFQLDLLGVEKRADEARKNATDVIIKYGVHSAKTAEELKKLGGFEAETLLALIERSKQLGTLDQDLVEYQEAHKALIRVQGLGATAQQHLNEITRGATEITRKQRERIGGLIGAFDDLGLKLKDNVKFQTSNLLKVGDFDAALKKLREEMERQIAKLEGGAKGLGKFGGTADLQKAKVAGLGARVRGLANDFASVPEKARAGSAEIGRAISEGIRQGILAGRASVLTAASDVAFAAIRGAQVKLGIKSPSSVFREIGQNIIKGLEEGMNDESLTSLIRDKFSKLIDSVKAKLDGVRSAAAALGQSVRSGFQFTLGDVEGGTGLEGETLPVTAADIRSAAREQANQASRLARLLEQAAAKGLNKGLLGELASGGAESIATLEALLSGGKGLIAEVNVSNRLVSQFANQTAGLLKDKFFGDQMERVRGKLDLIREVLRELLQTARESNKRGGGVSISGDVFTLDADEFARKVMNILDLKVAQKQGT